MLNKEISSLHTKAETEFSGTHYQLAKQCYQRAILHPEFEKEDGKAKAELVLGYFRAGMKEFESIKDKKSDDKLAELKDILSILDFSTEKEVSRAKVEILVNIAWIYIDDKKDVTKAYDNYLNASGLLSEILKTNESSKDKFSQELNDIYRCILSRQGDEALEGNDYSTAIGHYKDVIKILEESIRISRQKKSKKVNDRTMNESMILADTHYNMAKAYKELNDNVQAGLDFTIAKNIFAALQKEDDDRPRLEEYSESIKEVDEEISKLPTDVLMIIQEVNHQQPQRMNISKPNKRPVTEVSTDKNIKNVIAEDIQSFCKEKNLNIASKHIDSNLVYWMDAAKLKVDFDLLEKTVMQLLTRVQSDRILVNKEKSTIGVKGNTIYTLSENINKTTKVHEHLPKLSFLANKPNKEKHLDKKHRPEKSSKSQGEKRNMEANDSQRKSKKPKTRDELSKMSTKELEQLLKEVRESGEQKRAELEKATERLQKRHQENEQFLKELNTTTTQFNL